MLHVMSIEAVVVYDMYIKEKEGELDQKWKDDNIFDLCKFLYLFSNQIIKYNPTHWKCTGDSNIVPTTQQNQASR